MAYPPGDCCRRLLLSPRRNRKKATAGGRGPQWTFSGSSRQLRRSVVTALQARANGAPSGAGIVGRTAAAGAPPTDARLVSGLGGGVSFLALRAWLATPAWPSAPPGGRLPAPCVRSVPAASRRPLLVSPQQRGLRSSASCFASITRLAPPMLHRTCYAAVLECLIDTRLILLIRQGEQRAGCAPERRYRVASAPGTAGFVRPSDVKNCKRRMELLNRTWLRRRASAEKSLLRRTKPRYDCVVDDEDHMRTIGLIALFAAAAVAVTALAVPADAAPRKKRVTPRANQQHGDRHPRRIRPHPHQASWCRRAPISTAAPRCCPASANSRFRDAQPYWSPIDVLGPAGTTTASRSTRRWDVRAARAAASDRIASPETQRAARRPRVLIERRTDRIRPTASPSRR